MHTVRAVNTPTTSVSAVKISIGIDSLDSVVYLQCEHSWYSLDYYVLLRKKVVNDERPASGTEITHRPHITLYL